MGKTVDEECMKALKNRPFLNKFFSMKDELDAKVLENGSNLSGGDKQKIALARLYLENPDVIILDEMTNSIDESTSYDIINSIIDEYKDRIIFIISHDSNITRFCNKILYIEDKKLRFVSNEVIWN
jgi:ABC-type bacteriocin/lantibiotic exporter with double-glycine peptidase domain